MFLYAIALIIFTASPIGLCYWWGHAFTAIFALLNLHRVSRSYIFWLLFFVNLFFATEARFSIEYLFLSAGLVAYAIDPKFINYNSVIKKYLLFGAFVICFILDKANMNFVEQGSMLLWLPIFLVLFIKPDFNFIYVVSALMAAFGNKVTALIAYLSLFLKKKFLIVSIALLMVAGFIFRDKTQSFFKKSFKPRLYFFMSSAKGFLDKPITGHGFKTFALDYPPYRIHTKSIGGKSIQQVSHSHCLFTHMAFEQGLIGLSLLVSFFILVYQYQRNIFLPLLIISLCDMPMAYFNQFLLAMMLMLPGFVKIDNPNKLLALFGKTFNFPYANTISKIIIYFVALLSFVPSLMGHFYYDRLELDQAIKWDKSNSLYYFTRGAALINQDTVAAEEDLRKAVKLSPNIGYFYGFLAAAEHANQEIFQAKTSIAKAIDQLGDDAYLYALSSFINADNSELAQVHYAKAISMDPSIDRIIHDPTISASEYIGPQVSDPRINTFFRTGPVIYLPLPYVPMK